MEMANLYGRHEERGNFVKYMIHYAWYTYNSIFLIHSLTITLEQFGSISRNTPGNVFGMPENVCLCFDITPDNFWYAV